MTNLRNRTYQMLLAIVLGWRGVVMTGFASDEFSTPVEVSSSCPLPMDYVDLPGAISSTTIIHTHFDRVDQIQGFSLLQSFRLFENGPLYFGPNWVGNTKDGGDVFFSWKYAKPTSLTALMLIPWRVHSEAMPEKVVLEGSPDGLVWSQAVWKGGRTEPFTWFRARFVPRPGQTVIMARVLTTVQSQKVEGGYFSRVGTVVEVFPWLTGMAFLFYAILAASLYKPVRGWLLERVCMPASSTQSKLVSLDALRGLAALGIFLFHLRQWGSPIFDSLLEFVPVINQGRKAVPLFVLLSGFLIYRSLRKPDLSVADLRRYAQRRFFRIYPLYITTVVGWLVLCPNNLKDSLVNRIPAQIFMLPTLQYSSFFNPPAWSLYVEVLFYMLLPMAVIALGRHIIPFSIAFFIAAGVADPYVTTGFGNSSFTLALWKYFALGILACEFHERRGSCLGWNQSLFLLTFGVFMLWLDFNEVNWFGEAIRWCVKPFATLDLTTRTQGPNPGYPFDTVGLGIAGACIMVASIHFPPLRWLFSLAPFRILGTISYSLFLWHALLLNLSFPQINTEEITLKLQSPLEIYFLIALPAMIFLSMASFVLIERPFLNYSAKLTSRR